MNNLSTIGNRIKERRIEIGLSQEDLAITLGYKSRSSINKIEKDGRGLPQSKIIEISRALNTTPAYIMGWTDDSTLARDHIIELTDFEKTLILEYRKSDEISKEMVHRALNISFRDDVKKEA